MRWLKSLVIVLAALIAGALALLGYGFYKKSVEPDWRLFGAPPPVAAPQTPTPAPTVPAPVPPKAAAPVEPWGEINLGLGTGCRIDGSRTDGDRLYLTIGPDGPCHRLVVIDIAGGRVLGSIRTGP